MCSHVTCHVIHRLCMVYIYISAVYVHALQQVPYIATFSRPKYFANRCQNGCQKFSRIQIS